MSNGQRLFPNAELVIHENELAHWFDDGAMSKVDERSRQLYFGAGREQVAPYRDRTRLFRQGEVFPGVTAVPSLGHTPGHTAYLIASGNDQLMIWGDTVHVPEVQTAFPEAGMAFDTDLAAAAASRKRMFDRVSADGVLAPGTAWRRLCALSGGLGSQSLMLAQTVNRTISGVIVRTHTRRPLDQIRLHLSVIGLCPDRRIGGPLFVR
jgi:glyoxylase-like metal-dependent hydrolase (beta-lactamase superfamily II)